MLLTANRPYLTADHRYMTANRRRLMAHMWFMEYRPRVKVHTPFLSP